MGDLQKLSILGGVRNYGSFFPLILISLQSSFFESYLLEIDFSVVQKNY